MRTKILTVLQHLTSIPLLTSANTILNYFTGVRFREWRRDPYQLGHRAAPRLEHGRNLVQEVRRHHSWLLWRWSPVRSPGQFGQKRPGKFWEGPAVDQTRRRYRLEHVEQVALQGQTSPSVHLQLSHRLMHPSWNIFKAPVSPMPNIVWASSFWEVRNICLENFNPAMANGSRYSAPHENDLSL